MQEALTNCVRHARASHIAVSVSRQADSLAVSVTDDGVGFDLAQRAGGLGLRGIEERVRELHGVLTHPQRARRGDDADDEGAAAGAGRSESRACACCWLTITASSAAVSAACSRPMPALTIVAEAADGLEALRLCEEHHPETLIVDIGMPKMNGIEVAARSQKLERPPAVIILSMHSDESYITRALAAGARAYLLKDATDEDLLPAVRAVSAGKPYFSPAVTAVLVEDYMRQLRARGLTDTYHLLTDREKEVLQLLAEGRSNKEVATLLDLGLSTVETHRGNMMQKLNLHNTAEIVLYAVRKGIIV